MKTNLLALVVAFALIGLSTGCMSASGPGLRVGSNNPVAPKTWLGSDPHLVMVGTINGVAFSIAIQKDNPLLKEIKGKREYQRLVTTGETRYVAFEIGFGALMEGIEREIELEFENANFDKTSLEIDLGLVEKSNEELAKKGGLQGTQSNLELEWEWEDSKESTFASGEVLSKSGTLVRFVDQGATIGAWFTATFPGGSVTGSCTTTEAEDETDDVDAFYL